MDVINTCDLWLDPGDQSLKSQSWGWVIVLCYVQDKLCILI